MNYQEEIVVFKNDRIGDLMTSVPALRILIKENKDKLITIFLSKINHKIRFLFENENVNIIITDYNPSLKDRLLIITYLIKKKISKVFIIRPKNFFFYLPLIFFLKKTKFYGLCVNDKGNYKRPNTLLRKFLFKKVINDRNTRLIRPTRKQLQIDLVTDKNISKITQNEFNLVMSEELKNILPKSYCLIHYKHLMFDNLSWGREGLDKIIKHLLLNFTNVILINDIDRNDDNNYFRNRYDWYDFKSKKKNLTSKNILYFENIDGIDLACCINFSKITIACHGTITLLGDILNKPVLDLFYCSIKNKNDFYRYKNSFHEHVPNNNNYKFIIPKNDIKKTINKMNFALKNG